MSKALFVYGPLCHAPLRAIVLGRAVSGRAAQIAGLHVGSWHGSGLPGLVSGDGAAAGLLLDDLAADTLARVDFFAETLGYERCAVEVAGAPPAIAYAPVGDGETLDGGWDLTEWVKELGPIWVEAAHEVMSDFGTVRPEAMARRWPTTLMRAATRLRAAAGSVRQIRADFTAGKDVEILKQRRPYTEFFSLEDPDLRFRRFDGRWSRRVRHAGFVGGDAATVLPYDPRLDAVLLVEQFRAGPLLRGDPHPWSLEPIAGRIDPGESPEDCARREAMEEAGVALGALHRVADYYPTPGAVTEFLFSFVAEADLAGRGGVLGGEPGEDEDIRTHVVPFDRLMTLIETGEAGTGPLILSSYWLAMNRDRLRG